MKKPKIVIWDLETLPDPEKIYDVIPSIGAWPGRTFKAELQSILTFGYKIYGEKNAHTINCWDFKESWAKDRNDDSAVVAAAYSVLYDADEIVTHNGKQFDVKVMNTKLAQYGMPPLPKIPHVDTKIAAKKLSLYSNSLANVAKFFGVEDKMHFNDKWGLWKRIAFSQSTKKDLKLMSDYCKQDVDTLEAVYEKLRPYHGNNSVNKNFFSEERVCPTCGSHKLHKHGIKRTRTGEKQRFLCQDCGSISQEAKKGAS
jgi:DNA polymerase elongation subunit (family B)